MIKSFKQPDLFLAEFLLIRLRTDHFSFAYRYLALLLLVARAVVFPPFVGIISVGCRRLLMILVLSFGNGNCFDNFGIIAMSTDPMWRISVISENV